MKVYIKFISSIFFRSLFFVFFIILSLVFILNLLTELEFFKNIDVSASFIIFLSSLSSPSLIFEMFPFIILITTQLLFIKLFENKEIEIFKYSGLKNSKLLFIISTLSIITGIFLIALFYPLSSNLKNIYLEYKSNHTKDGKYLAVVTKNGLWIKDKVGDKIIITNSEIIENNFLINNFISEFDKNFKLIRNIKSSKIDITNNEWKVINARVFNDNNYSDKEILKIKTNFNFKRINTLYSNLSSLNINEILELRKNYNNLNYSIIDIDLHLLKLFSQPLYLLLISLFASLTMLNIKNIKSTTFKIAIGLFFSVIIYYLNNFCYALGGAERISIELSVFLPMGILLIVNSFMMLNVNYK